MHAATLRTVLSALAPLAKEGRGSTAQIAIHPVGTRHADVVATDGHCLAVVRVEAAHEGAPSAPTVLSEAGAKLVLAALKSGAQSVTVDGQRVGAVTLPESRESVPYAKVIPDADTLELAAAPRAFGPALMARCLTALDKLGVVTYVPIGGTDELAPVVLACRAPVGLVSVTIVVMPRRELTVELEATARAGVRVLHAQAPTVSAGAAAAE